MNDNYDASTLLLYGPPPLHHLAGAFWLVHEDEAAYQETSEWQVLSWNKLPYTRLASAAVVHMHGLSCYSLLLIRLQTTTRSFGWQNVGFEETVSHQASRKSTPNLSSQTIYRQERLELHPGMAPESLPNHLKPRQKPEVRIAEIFLGYNSSDKKGP